MADPDGWSVSQTVLDLLNLGVTALSTADPHVRKHCPVGSVSIDVGCFGSWKSLLLALRRTASLGLADENYMVFLAANHLSAAIIYGFHAFPIERVIQEIVPVLLLVGTDVEGWMGELFEILREGTGDAFEHLLKVAHQVEAIHRGASELWEQSFREIRVLAAVQIITFPSDGVARAVGA